MNRPNPHSNTTIFQKWIIQKLMIRLMQNWQWIILFILASLTVAFLFNRYSNKIYSSQVKIVKGNEDNTSTGAAFVLGNTYYRNILNTEYERAFFTSTPALRSVIMDMNLLVTYYSKGYVRTYERYGDLPFTLKYDEKNNRIPYNVRFRILADGENYKLTADDKDWKSRLQNKEFTFDKEAEVDGFRFTVKKNFTFENRGDWMFRINRLDDLAGYYKGLIKVDVASNYGQVGMLRLTIISPVPEKDKVFLDHLVEEIRNRDVQQKIESSGRTLSFIEEQLGMVTDTMEFLAKKLRDLKMDNKELSAGSSSVFDRISVLEERKAYYVLSDKYCVYLRDYIKSKSQEEVVAPSVLGIDNEALNNLVQKYIDLRLQVYGDGQLGLESSLYRKDMEKQQQELAAFEDVLLESIASTMNTNAIQIAEFDRQISGFLTTARTTLSEEIVYNDNERLYSLNEKVFTHLMDKKAEAGISRAALISDYRPLEPAFTSSVPLQPKTSRNYVTALLLGIMVPLLFFFQRIVMKNTLLSLSELEDLVHLPVVGMIGEGTNPTVVRDDPKSLVAENFRTLRSNLKYIREGSDRLILLITSSVGEEGKSFITSNLSAALGLQGKRCVVIGADLRKPTLKSYFGRTTGAGLSEYLSGQAEMEEILQKSSDENLFLIHSGQIPPNPAELLSGRRMGELIKLLRPDFEYILIDTPPIGTISDASELFSIADAIIMVTRQDKTPVAALQQINHFFDKSSLEKTVVLFNGVKSGQGYGSYGYRFGYGYGYGEYYRT